MISDAIKIQNINTVLVKSLLKYLIFINLVLIVIVFGFSLFDEDTKAYFLKQDDNLILGEVNNTPDYQKDLDSKIDTLNKNGILVQHDETIFTTSGYVKSNYISEYVSIHVAETFMYTENQIVGTIDWLFQKPLEGGVYISEEVYRKLESPIQIDIEINKAIFKLPINGVYNIKKKQAQLFYQDEDYINNYLVIDNKSFPLQIKSNSISYLVLTTYPIKEKDLGLINQLYDEPILALTQKQETHIFTKIFYDIIINLIIVLISMSLLISIMVLYRFFIEIRPILLINTRFHATNMKTFMISFLSAFLIILKSFVIPLIFYGLLTLLVYIKYGYFIWIPLIIGFIFLLIMIIITIVFSTLNIFYTKKDSTYNLII